ncbi:MAG: hypothetical protein FGM33_05760 [Candidatus Kapabacteria bacterium]|nr:hypothetical protein [Candidatus Kapabacteria bacterium]
MNRTPLAMSRSLGLCCITVMMMLTSCDKVDQEGQKLVSTYARVLVERQTGLDSASTAKHIDSILKASGYSVEEFERQLRSHGTTPQNLKSFYDSVSTELSRMRSDSTR